MTKKIIIPSSLKQIDNLINDCDGFIIGIKDLSVNLPVYFELDELKEIAKLLESKDKELFISLNKNMHNKDLEYLKKVLIELETITIKGILYYDVSIINLKQELNLKNDLVFSQEHATTNYATINYYQMMGANYTYLSNEITIDEIIEIKENTDSKLLVNILGYIPMFVSERKLISNYLTYFNIDDNSSKYYLEKENKTYHIVEDDNATMLYSNFILNGIDEIKKLKENNIEYIVLNSFEIEEDKFEFIVKKIDTITSEEVNKILENTSDGFLHTETIYKVKNYEK